MNIQQCQDQGHAHVYAVLYLAEICGARIIVNLHCDLIYSRERMEHVHILRSKFHLLFVQDIEILHAHVIFFVEETLLLYTGHVKNVKARQRILQTDNFLVWNIVAVKDFMTDIVGKSQLFR